MKIPRTGGCDSGMSFLISICAAVIPALAVFLGMIAMGVEPPIALLPGCFAAATAPTAILDVVQESGIKNRFSELLLLIVVLDDVWALILFGIGMTLVASNHFPEYRQIMLPIVIASTVVFEIIGPVFTRQAIQRSNRDS
jgi:Kef-type K+ transport system membrane component KefB